MTIRALQREGKKWIKIKDYNQLYETIKFKDDSVYVKVLQEVYPTEDTLVTLPLSLPVQRIEKRERGYWFWRALIPGVFIGGVIGVIMVASGDEIQFD